MDETTTSPISGITDAAISALTDLQDSVIAVSPYLLGVAGVIAAAYLLYRFVKAR